MVACFSEKANGRAIALGTAFGRCLDNRLVNENKEKDGSKETAYISI